jgi:hypothetical protein
MLLKLASPLAVLTEVVPVIAVLMELVRVIVEPEIAEEPLVRCTVKVVKVLPTD